MNNPAADNSKSDQRRLDDLVAEVRARRAAGVALPDHVVLDAHPGLRPALDLELRKLALIHRARQFADPRPATEGAIAESTALGPDSIPGYEILGEIHRGSQGVVYRALQKSTRREVAIKVIRQGPFADADDRMRFDREVRVLSALQHPNVVSIHDSGAAAGHSYFVMNYIEGEPLDQFVARTRPKIDEILRLMVKVCDAVSAAQLCGVVHRDLKPGNIRIDRRGEPHVLDFGLAKIDPATAVRVLARLPGTSYSADQREPSATGEITHTGQFVGSLPWAAPEQAEGRAGTVDVRTDVYALGVILYQALTGKFPYRVTGSFSAVLENIRQMPPARPSALRPEINDETETIVLKCLQKERARRYQNAGELSADLQRYLRGEPIDAKRDSHLYLMRKQLRRYWIPLGATVAVIVSLIAGIVATTRSTWRAQRAEADAVAIAQAESHLRQRADWANYKACLAAADAALIVNNSTGASASLDAAPPALRGWEWRSLKARLDQALANVPLAELSGWADFMPGRRRVLCSVDGSLKTIDLDGGTIAELCRVQNSIVTTFALSADGRRIALGLRGGEIDVRDAADGHEVARFRAHAAGDVSALALSADGTLLATGPWTEQTEYQIQIWDAATGQLRGSMPIRNSWVPALAFAPDGRTLATAHTKPNASFQMWDVESGRETLSVSYEGLDVQQLAFSPDGRLIAIASQDPAIHLYECSSGHLLQTFAGHTAKVQCVAFDALGKRLVSGAADQTVRVWDVESGKTLACRRGHRSELSAVSFQAESDSVFSISMGEGVVKRWDSHLIEEPLTLDTGRYFVLMVAFTPDGRRLFTHRACWDPASGALVTQLPPHEGRDTNEWLSADNGTEWNSNVTGGELISHGSTVMRTSEALLFRPLASSDGQRLALGLKRGAVQVYSTGDGALIREIPIDAAHVSGAAFSRNHEQLATWTNDGHWAVTEVASGRELISERHGVEQIVNVVFSQDDRLIATTSYDGAARVCDATTGKTLRTLRPAGAPAGDQGVMWSAAFSPDGTRLATGSKDRRVRLWDVATGEELMALTRHAGTVMCLAWSPDGTQLASGGFDGTVCLWDSLSHAERLQHGARSNEKRREQAAIDPLTP